MGAEEEKKPSAAAEVVDKKAEEEKKEEKPAEEEKPAAAPPAEDEKKDEKKEGGEDGKKETKGEEVPPPPPPPQEIVLKVYMHCEGCARKVRRCLKGFDGVEDVITDCKTSKVVVKGEKADPLKVLERIQRKSHRQVELISPIPKPPSDDDKKAEDEKPKPPPEEPKPEPPPPVITVVLQVYMHCEACAMEIKKRIQRMKGMLLSLLLAFIRFCVLLLY
ncbi:Heavy metal-associated isoprenylated plant protein 7 [Linum perenne]